jgi:tetratricopeptide (TPR) repeat protein
MAISLDAVYPTLRYLIVEDAQAMLVSLRSTLVMMGAEKIDIGASVADVLFKCGKQKQVYDIVICDNDLQGERGGQELLEELRHRNLMPPRTVFVMISGQRSYQSVMYIAECAPDTYLIKPFTSQVLALRVEQAVRKRLFFNRIHEAVENQEIEKALSIIDEKLKNPGPFEVELLRQKTNLLLEEHRFEETRPIFHRVSETYRLPWAQLGLARLAVVTKDFEEAARILSTLVANAPKYLTAWDLYATVLLEMGQKEKAMATLDAALRYSPHSILRQRQVGQVALMNRDMARALKAWEHILKYGRTSALITPSDYASGIALTAASGKPDQARKVLREAEKAFPGHPVLQAGSRMIEAEFARKADEPEKAIEHLEGLITLVESIGAPAIEVPLTTAVRSAALLGDEALSEKLAAAAISHDHGSHRSVQMAAAMMADGGFKDSQERIENIARREIAAINNKAVKLAKTGHLMESVNLLLAIAQKDNTTTIAQLNAAQAILMFLEEKGWNDELARQGRKLLERVSMSEPEHPRLAKLKEMMQTQLARQRAEA